MIMESHITLRSLPGENLRRKPLRTAALGIVVTLLSLALFAGSLLSLNLDNGMRSMERRLGADLMVVPQNSAQQAEALLTSGSPGTFYFTRDVASAIAKADGVAQSTEQVYISSLAASCCSSKLQIIGYDPGTDFVIQPWLSSQFDGNVKNGQIVAGAGVNVTADGTIELYGRAWPVVAQLASTGTSLDNSVFINRATVPQMVEASAQVSHRVMPAEYANKAVSAVLIKVADGYDPHIVAKSITKLDRSYKNLGFVYPGGITASTKASLGSLVGYTAVFVAVLWVMGVIVLLAVFFASVNERKREFAVLRIMGATRGMLRGVIVREAVIVSLAGSVIGVALASLIVFPFSTLIGRQLQLPYLQAGLLNVIGLMVVSVACSVAVCVAASMMAMRKLARPEAYLTLREGQ